MNPFPPAAAPPPSAPPPEAGAPPKRTRFRMPRLPAVRLPARAGRRTPDVPCRNCGDGTVGFYCPRCGQRKFEVRVSVRRMLMEVLDDQFSLNSALPRTLWALFFRPGHLTREYLEGRIVRYIPPFRLYVVSSLVFFLGLRLLPDMLTSVTVQEEPGLRVAVSSTDRAPAPPPAAAAADIAAAEAAEAASGAGWAEGLDVRTGNAVLDSAFAVKIDRLNRMHPREASATVLNAFLEHVPQMMFVLLPVYALLLKLLYLRRKRFYVEHFVFALHLHAFTFLAFSLAMLARGTTMAEVLTAWPLVYAFLAMKKVYGQGWLRTLTKYLTLGAAYLVVASIASFLTILLSVALL